MNRILFLGEGRLEGPRRYFAAVLRHARLPFDHCPDQKPIPSVWLKRRYGAMVLSDYRHSSFSAATERWLVRQVQGGTGLLMIGGWASFTGLVGGYAGSAIEPLLPVRCIRGDDRVNYASGSLITRTSAHPLLTGIHFRQAPVVCGYHRTTIKPGSRVILTLRDLRPGRRSVGLGKPHPLLVVGEAGRARTAAVLTDCAPHWAGGLVDWGNHRVTVPIGQGEKVEVGDFYLKFFSNLVRWVGGLSK